MDQITLENYRCFRDKQVVRLAPLTLLVGENSTGKTSFMAMIRALWDIAYRQRIPNFNQDPYDLGSFDRISHKTTRHGNRPAEITAGFAIASRNSTAQTRPSTRFNVTFEKKGAVPIPVRRRITKGEIWAEVHTIDSLHKFHFETSRENVWQTDIPNYHRGLMDASGDPLPSFNSFIRRLNFGERSRISGKEQRDFPSLDEKDFRKGLELVRPFERPVRRPYFASSLYASAPVRSKPRRIYDLSSLTHESDPEGDYIPMYFAKLHSSDRKAWDKLRASLENFGQQSGLFDEISMTSLGKHDSGFFQVQIRKFSPKQKGAKHNLVDVGYGVSQVLPVITELLRPERPAIFLYQQPEVHLHPSAQAALGSLFCRTAGRNRRCQLIVETHSDYLLDRVRMDIRDNETALGPDDVSILFFERDGLSVGIHSLSLDQEGNVLYAPDSYRTFFLEETARSLWKKQPRGG